MMNGKILIDAYISASNNLNNNRARVDALNVFPVPDGDTGTNMSMTLSAAARELEKLDPSTPIGEVASVAASALLRGARGNSGVITSLLFRGFARGLKGKTTAGPADLVAAMEIGVSSAYGAVMKPTEGTMLTVARVSTEKARAALTDTTTVPELWDGIVAAAKETLAQTPEMLPVLKKAGVVDSGGAGLVCIYEGMRTVFDGEGLIDNAPGEETGAAPLHPDTDANGDYVGEITYTYCTEFIVYDRDVKKDPVKLRRYLESIGDCVVVVDDEDIIKCHVHTDAPGDALQKALEFGPLTKLKIENMRIQYADNMRHPKQEDDGHPTAAPSDDTPNGFVAVAAGDGVRQLFADLGVQAIVQGGQTMNPSTEDILTAIDSLPCRNVFVLPNNKNIIMAAEQAAKLTEKRVFVVPTRSIPQGLSAMLAFDFDAQPDDNAAAMARAAEKVGTGQITFAARDSEYEGTKIKKGELLALENGKVAFTDTDLRHAALRLIRSLSTKNTAFVTLIYGEDVTAEQAKALEDAVRPKLPANADLAVVSGGQPVYYLIISVE